MKDMKIRLRVTDDIAFEDVARFLLVARDIEGVTELVASDTFRNSQVLTDGPVTHIRCEGDH